MPDPRMYVLDCDVLSLLAKHVAPELSVVGRLPVAIPEMVWDEAARGRDKRVAADRVGLMKAIATAPVTWDDADAIHDDWKKIKLGVERKLGVGERAVIAYTLNAPAATAVLRDKLAALRAIEHLRGRVLSTFGLLGALVEDGRIPPVLALTFEARYRLTGTGADHPAPLWWPAHGPAESR